MADDYRGCGAGSVFLAFVMGAAIGGGLALLAAPRSGEETREKMRGMADDVREKVRKVVADAESQIRESIDEGREVLQEKKEMVKAAIDAGREAMEAERARHQKPA